jgi:DNA-binding MarR family transcriptional regulator
MQQLQNASDPLSCAATVMEAVLDVMLMVREQTARRHHDRPSLIHVRAMGTLRKRPGATLSALSDQLALTPSATSRLVECLVEKGLIARVIPPGNRRTVSLHLTPVGRKLHSQALQLAHRELAKTLTQLAPAQRQTLTKAMALLSHTLDNASQAKRGVHALASSANQPREMRKHAKA